MWWANGNRTDGKPGGLAARLAVVLATGIVLAISNLAGSATAAASTPNQTHSGALEVQAYGPSSVTQDDQMQVRTFRVEGFGFAPGQLVAISFAVQSGDGPTGSLPGTNRFGPYPTDSTGHFASEYFNRVGTTLTSGHYTVTAYGKDSRGAWVSMGGSKTKVFKVFCPPVKNGTLTVTKQLKDGSDPAGAMTFPIVVTCTAADYEHTFDLAVGASATTEPLPDGTTCTVSETPPTGWDPPTYDPAAAATVQADETVAVAVVNNRRHTEKPVAGLTLVKTHQPTGAVKPGDVIAYGLTATATGNVAQDGVVIADVMPAHTAYVAGSAACVPSGHSPCDIAYDKATRTLTVGLGTMAPGDVLGVKFSVRVDADVPPTSVITDIGTARSERAKATSNRVTNTIVKVLGEHVSKPTTAPGPVLAATGPGAPAAASAALGLALTLAGLALLAGSRRRPKTPRG